jgi:hypothetical protein
VLYLHYSRSPRVKLEHK